MSPSVMNGRAAWHMTWDTKMYSPLPAPTNFAGFAVLSHLPGSLFCSLATNVLPQLSPCLSGQNGIGKCHVMPCHVMTILKCPSSHRSSGILHWQLNNMDTG